MASVEISVNEDGPGEKTKKYDRQLRLWGDHGQTALESAKVCLINATANGTETLKNLILPGIGSFTIVDGNKVTGADVGNNFFLEKERIGMQRRPLLNHTLICGHDSIEAWKSSLNFFQSRAQVATELLLELNDDVTGDFVDENIDTLLDNNQVFFNNFSIVIATDLPERVLLRLGALLWDYDVPLIVCRSIGLVGYIRVVIKDHTVVESHPDSALEDLRLDHPFPTLVSYCDSLDLDTMSKKEHSHTPWLVLLYKYLELWKADHNGAAPKNYREKTQFKEYIRNGIRKNKEGAPKDEENYEEAIKSVNTALVPTKVPYEVEQIFNDSRCTDLHSESSSFWILVRALKEFTQNEGEGMLPLRGSIPDMTADSERYIQLQNVYKQQAEQHVAAVTNHVHAILHSLGKDEPRLKRPCRSPSSSPRKNQEVITERDVRQVCRNASFLRVQSGRSLCQEYSADTAQSADLGMSLEDPDSDAVLYVMLRAVDKFNAEFSRYPGTSSESMEADFAKLKFCVTKQMQEWGLTHPIKDDYIQEFCRYGASELHTVAAYIGGVAAQEVIKVITGQFLPVSNTYIYNAIRQSSVTLLL